MAFNRSAFSAKAMASEIKNQTSLNEGKVTYDSTKSGHSWFKLINGIMEFKRPKDPCKLAFNVLPFMNRGGDLKFMHHDLVHYIPGGEGNFPHEYKCLGRNICPVCAIKNKLDNGNVDWEEIKAYVPKKRTLMLLNPVGTDDVLLLDTATQNRGKAFPEMLMNQATAMSEDNGVIDFASLDEGKQVIVSFVKQSFNGHEFMDFGAVTFRDRTEEISDEVLNKIPDAIEDLFNLGPNDADEMETLINGGSIDEEKAAEEQKQDDFETACEASVAPKPSVQTENAKDYGDMTLDFDSDPYTKKAAVSESNALKCPNNFDIRSEYGTHRQCMRCPFAEKCEKIAG